MMKAESYLEYIKCIFIGLIVILSFLICNNYQQEFFTNINFSELVSGYGIEYIIITILIGVSIHFILYNGIMESCKINRRGKIILNMISLLFGVFQVAGSNMAYADSLMTKQGIRGIYIFAFCVLGYSIGFYIMACFLILMFDRVKRNDESCLERNYVKFGVYSFIIILAIWLIWIIAYYPASVDYDTEWQICSFLGLRPRSNHHPWISSCLIGLFFKFGRSLNNDNLGIFMFIIIRAVLMAFIYSRCLVFLVKNKVKDAVVVIMLFFYALTPVWGAYAKQPFKDTLAAALFCWFVLRSIVLVTKLYNAVELELRDCLMYSLSGLAVSLCRNNYYYVYLIISLVLSIVFIKLRAGGVRILGIYAGILIYVLLNYVITNYWDVAQTEAVEALSLPIQQTARTVKFYGEEMSDTEKEGINGILDFNSIGGLYDPVISDPVKATGKTEATKEDYKNYFIVWFKQLFRHPVTYVEATLAGTYGYYSFTRDGYPTGGYGNCGMVIIDGINKDHNAHFDEYFNFNYLDRFQSIRIGLETFYRTWHNVPIFNITDTIPLYTWLLVIAFFYEILKGERLLSVPILAALIAILTCIASPINGSFRYFAPIAASVPALFACINPIQRTKDEKYSEINEG